MDAAAARNFWFTFAPGHDCPAFDYGMRPTEFINRVNQFNRIDIPLQNHIDFLSAVIVLSKKCSSMDELCEILLQRQREMSSQARSTIIGSAASIMIEPDLLFPGKEDQRRRDQAKDSLISFVRHPCVELLGNHISTYTETSGRKISPFAASSNPESYFDARHGPDSFVPSPSESKSESKAQNKGQSQKPSSNPATEALATPPSPSPLPKSPHPSPAVPLPTSPSYQNSADPSGNISGDEEPQQHIVASPENEATNNSHVQLGNLSPVHSKSYIPPSPLSSHETKAMMSKGKRTVSDSSATSADSVDSVNSVDSTATATSTVSVATTVDTNEAVCGNELGGGDGRACDSSQNKAKRPFRMCEGSDEESALYSDRESQEDEGGHSAHKRRRINNPRCRPSTSERYTGQHTNSAERSLRGKGLSSPPSSSTFVPCTQDQVGSEGHWRIKEDAAVSSSGHEAEKGRNENQNGGLD